MKESKYLKFFFAGYAHPRSTTKVYDVISIRSSAILGHIRWYAPWRQYCFMPSPGCVFNVGCMRDIIAFIGELMEERK